MYSANCLAIPIAKEFFATKFQTMIVLDWDDTLQSCTEPVIELSEKPCRSVIALRDDASEAVSHLLLEG